MAISREDALEAARDVATHTLEKASDIVENAGHILKGDIGGGTGDIVRNSLDIGRYAVDRTKEIFTGEDVDEDE